MSRVLSVAPVLPDNSYAQDEITEVIGPLLAGAPRPATLLRRVHANAGVDRRHFALPLDEYAGLDSFGAANAAFVREGTGLAERACRAALERAGLSACDVDLLFFTSVTGVSAPSIDALLAGRLGLRPDVRRLPSFGLGCAGGAAGLARVDDYLRGRPGDVALLVSVELCSLTLQHGDERTASLVASGLFGDGAAAVVVVGDEHAHARPGSPRTTARAGTRVGTRTGTQTGRQTSTGTAPRTARVVDSRSRLYAGTSGELGWDVRDSGFGVVLSPALPELIGAHLLGDVKDLLDEHGLTVEQVPTWVVHAGGPRVLDAVRDALGLPEEALRESRASLAAAGNLSSTSVLHVLAGTLERSAAPPGSPAVLMAFGPGVGAELVLLRLPEEA